MLKLSSSLLWRLGSKGNMKKITNHNIIFKRLKLDASTVKKNIEQDENKSGLIAAAFASLSDPENEELSKQASPKSVKLSAYSKIDQAISSASDVASLLKMAESTYISRKHALKIVSKLSEWTSTKKVTLSDFEKDYRFLKLCRILARTPVTDAMSSISMGEDLSTVLGITGEDEAARLISSLTLSQMVKVMQALQQKSRRSTPLLHAVAQNIIKQSQILDLKKSADLLFCMSSLNFPDPLLLDRICKDVIESLPSNNEKASIVCSIAISLSSLKYRDEDVIASIVKWTMDNQSICKPSNYTHVLIMLATLDYMPPYSDELFEMIYSLKEEDMAKTSLWLDTMFSLLVLDKAKIQQLTPVLRPEFIDRLLSAGDIPITARRKLVAIESFVQMQDPSAPKLPDFVSMDIPLINTKHKNVYLQSIMETFQSLVSAEAFMKKNCNSGMGFLFDAEFAVDKNCNPVALAKAENDKNVYRIAVMGLQYHDLTRKHITPLGFNQLNKRLLEMKGYLVLQIPYTEYNSKDKLLTRVQYVEKKLKDIVKHANLVRT